MMGAFGPAPATQRRGRAARAGGGGPGEGARDRAAGRLRRRAMWRPLALGGGTDGAKRPELERIVVAGSNHSPGPIGRAGEFHSQVGQDWLVASLLNCAHNGFFLDVGAHDAKFLSNTLALERDFGWR